MQTTTRVILVRHGRSTFNDLGRYQGSSNQSVLTAKGLETARLVGQHLRHQPIDIIFASPLQRVQQTALEISKALVNQPSITTSSDLKEISLSRWEGLSYQHVKEHFASDYECWQHRPHEFQLPTELPTASSPHSRQSDYSGKQLSSNLVAIAPKTYFPVRDLYQAARQFWATLLPHHLGKTILIVSHSGTIHALISTALGISPEHHHCLQQSNCGISELSFTQQTGTPPSVKLHQLNQTTAIGEALPKLKINKQGLRLMLLASDLLTPAHYRTLAARLKVLPIDFYLSSDDSKAHVQALFSPSSKALWLGSQKPDFLQNWHRHLCSSRRPTDTLMNGLAIAPSKSIQNLLIQTLGGATEAYEHIGIQPANLSIIHYPYTHRSVVQAINI